MPYMSFDKEIVIDILEQISEAILQEAICTLKTYLKVDLG